jgi:RNA polymerase sigma-70 factor (ECF subfamily)
VRTGMLERAQEGDHVSFGELHDLDGDRCDAIAYRILRDVERSQDAVQQAFLLAWRELPRLRDPERIDVWLHRLLVNACYREARRGRRRAANVRALSIDEPASSNDYISVVERDQLERGFRRLPPEQRAVFVFHHHLGLTHLEIAEELGIPVGTVKSRLHYATSTLRAALEADLRLPTDTSGERLA